MTDTNETPAEETRPAEPEEERPRRPEPELESFDVTGESTNAFFSALAKAQGTFTVPTRSSKVKITTRDDRTYEFEYAPIEKIIEATRPHLSANGLALIQPVGRVSREAWELRTIIAGFGCTLSSRIRFGVPSRWDKFRKEWVRDDDPKSLGSLITYYRRYSLAAILGVAADEDDDGSAANGDHVTKREPQTTKPRSTAQSPANVPPRAPKETPQPAAPSEAPKAAPEPPAAPQPDPLPSPAEAQAPGEPPRQPSAPPPAPGTTSSGDRRPTRDETSALIDAFNKAGIRGGKRTEYAMTHAGTTLGELSAAQTLALVAKLGGA